MKIAIILAREKSKRILNKNIKNFNGKPMIYWTIAALKKSKIFNSIIVSTDSKKIAKIAEKYSTFSFVTMDNPRTESLEKINLDIIKGFSNSDYEVISDRNNAIQAALDRMEENSILLVLGKGRENYQMIGSESELFDLQKKSVFFCD